MMKKKETSVTDTLVRVALYIRVSGEEQKIKGLSLEAQQERLESYARDRGWIITGIYIDAAKTARKKLHKRTEFQRMLDSVRRDEVDILLFTRLDRWFRSVSDYYKIMDVLDAHGCEWKTTDEEYDTTTANGRLYINVKLSIAQNESDIDSERIDVVFDSKIIHGTSLSGCCPFGYVVNKDKRLDIVPDQAAIVQDAFNHYERTVSKRGTVTYIRNTYGVNWCEATFYRMLADELYTGVYNRRGRYNPDFCPQIIQRDQFDRVQVLLKRNARSNPSGRVYIFTSLLVCDECRHNLAGYTAKNHTYYRCNQHYHRAKCSNNRSFPEHKLESWLFDHLGDEIDRCQLDWDVAMAKKKRAAATKDKAALRSKLAKLKDLYVNDLIDIEDYKKDYEVYTAALNQLPEPELDVMPNFAAVRKLLDDDFRQIYDGLSREDKRTLWRSVIKEIRVNSGLNVTGIIFG